MVNAVTKAYPRGYDKPVVLLQNNATLIYDENEKESLCVSFACMEHGIQIDMVPTKYGGLGGMTVEGDLFHLILIMRNCLLKFKTNTGRVGYL